MIPTRTSPNTTQESPWPSTRIVEVMDERDPVAEQALELIAEAFDRSDRQPVAELRSEVEEKRLGLLTAMNSHLLAALSPEGNAVGTAAGIYLEGVNAGFITYLTVARDARGRQLGPALRSALVAAFRDDACRAGFRELAWVLGEVRADSPWLLRLLKRRSAITFDLTYLHPGMHPERKSAPYVLYRQPIGDSRPVLSADEVRRVLYSIYRRAYRVRYPLQHPGFRAMLVELEAREDSAAGPSPVHLG